MAMQTQDRRGTQGPRVALAQIVLSVGGYYLLRAFGADVFSALLVPAVVVGVITVVVTLRRNRIDLVGCVVLAELVLTLTLAAVTHSPQIAALREIGYVLLGGLFCLGTLLRPAPLTHVAAAAVATFGDRRREWAFEHAWRTVPEYRTGQRLLTAALGSIMTIATLVRAWILLSADDAGIASAVDRSNVVGLVMVVLMVIAGVLLVRRPRRIVTELAARG